METESTPRAFKAYVGSATACGLWQARLPKDQFAPRIQLVRQAPSAMPPAVSLCSGAEVNNWVPQLGALFFFGGRVPLLK